jgi:antirestriction protein
MIKVALTNLGKYNEGSLVYKWLDLPATEDEIKETLDSIGINEQYEEYFISDYETDIEGLTVGEYDSLNNLNEFAEAYENLEEYEREALGAIIEATSYDTQECLEILQDGDYQYYSGVDLTELAEQMVDDGLFGDQKDMGNLVNYIDYERLGRDLGYDGYTVVTNGVIRVDR